MRWAAGGFFLALLLASGCIGNQGFGKYWNDFSTILKRNGADSKNLLPPTLEQLNGLEVELSAYQVSVEKQPSSSDKEAILRLVEAELNLMHMQQNVLLAQEQTRLANLAFPSCEKNSNLGKAIMFFENASAQAILAEQNLQSFASAFPSQSQQTGIDFEAMRMELEGSKQGIQQAKETVKQFCP